MVGAIVVAKAVQYRLRLELVLVCDCKKQLKTWGDLKDGTRRKCQWLKKQHSSCFKSEEAEKKHPSQARIQTSYRAVTHNCLALADFVEDSPDISSVFLATVVKVPLKVFVKRFSIMNRRELKSYSSPSGTLLKPILISLWGSNKAPPSDLTCNLAQALLFWGKYSRRAVRTI